MEQDTYWARVGVGAWDRVGVWLRMLCWSKRHSVRFDGETLPNRSYVEIKIPPILFCGDRLADLVLERSILRPSSSLLYLFFVSHCYAFHVCINAATCTFTYVVM